MDINTMTNGELMGAAITVILSLGATSMMLWKIAIFARDRIWSGQVDKVEKLVITKTKPIEDDCQTIIRGMAKLTEAMEGGFSEQKNQMEAHEEVMGIKFDTLESRFDKQEAKTTKLFERTEKNGNRLTKVETLTSVQ